MIKMTRRAAVKIISFTVAVIAVISAFAIIKWRESGQARYVLSAVYQQEIADAAAMSRTLLSSLEKLSYAGTDYQFVTLATKASRSAESARESLLQLPGAQEGLMKTSALLCLTSDYCEALTRKILSGEELSREELSTLRTLSAAAEGVCAALMSMEAEVLDENPDAVGLAAMFSSAESSADEADVSGFGKIESDIEALPTLIYDGPFSDGVMNKKSVFLPDKSPVEDEKARQIGAYGLDVSEELPELAAAVDFGGEECLYFTAGDMDVYVTRRGGYIKNLSRSAEAGDAAISFEEAVSLGLGELSRLGYKSMTATYYEESDNVLFINYAYIQNQVICYTDLIKVGIGLDNGKAVFIDATNYLLNHSVSRSFEALISPEEAAAAAQTEAQAKKALIPTAGGDEVFCYEFLIPGEEGRNSALVYINARTGKEENILILLESENGTLVY